MVVEGDKDRGIGIAVKAGNRESDLRDECSMDDPSNERVSDRSPPSKAVDSLAGKKRDGEGGKENEKEIGAASVAMIDRLLEAGDYDGIRALEMTVMDATRLVTYLKAIAVASADAERVHEVEKVCYDLLVSHGALSEALAFAVRLDVSHIRQLFALCKDAIQKPHKSTAVVEGSNVAIWCTTACLNYKDTPIPTLTPTPTLTSTTTLTPAAEPPKVASVSVSADEGEIRLAMRRQLAYQLSSYLNNFPISELFSDQELAEMPETERAELESVLRREYVSGHFETLSKELDVRDVRSVDRDVFKLEAEDQPEGGRRRGGRGFLRADPTGAGLSLSQSQRALSSAYASALTHVAFGEDAFLVKDEELQKCKQHGLSAATAGLGLLSLWNIEQGITQIDRYQYSTDMFLRAGAVLGFGLSSCNVANECDPVLALATDALNSANAVERLAAYASLGYAFVGTNNLTLLPLLAPVVVDPSTLGGEEACAQAALALGFVFVGTANETAAEAILQFLLENQQPTSIHSFNFAVALALIFLNKSEASLAVTETLAAINHPLANIALSLTIACAHAGTGDTDLIQKFIHESLTHTRDVFDRDSQAAAREARRVQKETEARNLGQNAEGGAATDPAAPKPAAAASGAAASGAADGTEVKTPIDPESSAMGEGETMEGKDGKESMDKNEREGKEGENKEEEEDEEEAAASPRAKELRNEMRLVLPLISVLCLSIIGLRDPLAGDMLLRLLTNFVQFDDELVRRGVSLALGFINASAPMPAVVDLLSKLAEDKDADTSLHAILALGLVGGGTNNARIAQTLKRLSEYYTNDSSASFLARLAQGMLHAGKGLVSFSPLTSDKFIIDPAAFAGLLAFTVSALFAKNTLCLAVDTGPALSSAPAATASGSGATNANGTAATNAGSTNAGTTNAGTTNANTGIESGSGSASGSTNLDNIANIQGSSLRTRYHLNFFHLTPAIHPRWLITLDYKTLEPVSIAVRVGNAVDVAGMAGDPTRVSGARTHLTPVLLAFDEKAEIGTDLWQPFAYNLQGIVLVRKLGAKEKQLASKYLDI